MACPKKPEQSTSLRNVRTNFIARISVSPPGLRKSASWQNGPQRELKVPRKFDSKAKPSLRLFCQCSQLFAQSMWTGVYPQSLSSRNGSKEFYRAFLVATRVTPRRKPNQCQWPLSKKWSIPVINLPRSLTLTRRVRWHLRASSAQVNFVTQRQT